MFAVLNARTARPAERELEALSSEPVNEVRKSLMKLNDISDAVGQWPGDSARWSRRRRRCLTMHGERRRDERRHTKARAGYARPLPRAFTTHRSSSSDELRLYHTVPHCCT